MSAVKQSAPQQVHIDDMKKFICDIIEKGNCKVKLSIDACGESFTNKAITTVQIIETSAS